MSICLGVLWSTVCLQLCFKNRFYIFPSKAIPPNRVSTSFFSSRPCSHGRCSTAVQPLVIQQTHKLQISRPTSSSRSCPAWVSSSICCSQLSCNNIFQRTKERNFHTYWFSTVGWNINKGKPQSPILFFSWLSPLSLNTEILLMLSQIHTLVHETFNYFS